MKTRSMTFVYISFVFIIVLMLTAAMIFPGMNLKQNIVKPPVLNEGWKVRIDGVSISSNSVFSEIQNDNLNIPSRLPYRLPLSGGSTVSLEQVLGPAFSESQSMLLRGSLQNIIVRLDDEIIYDRVFNDDGIIVMPYVSAWNIFSIPAGSEGKTLSIEIYSPFKGMAGQLGEIYYGQNGLLLLHLQRTYGVGFMIAVLIFIIGLVLTVSPLVFHRLEYSETSAVGSFAMITSIYLISESRILDLLIGSQFILGSLAYITLALIPVPLLLYMREIANTNYKRVFSLLTIAHFVDVLIILVFQITGVAPFFETLILTHALLAITSFTSIYILFVESKRNKNRDARLLLQGLSIMVLFGLIELIYFYLFDYVQVSSFLRTGVLLFVAILSIQSIQRIGKTRRRLFQSELYEKLAFTDQLTNAPNRMAFERDLYLLFQKPPSDYIYVGFFDLNNLKSINDLYGHKFGDEAIIRSYAVIQELFSPHGRCYRIGGDEFACILKGLDLSTIESMADKLNASVEAVNNELFYPFVIAQGYAELDRRRQTTVDELMHEADQNMYKDKALKKSTNPVPT